MSKRVTDEVCLKIRGANIVAQVTLQYLWGKPWCRPVQKIAKARDLLAKDGQWCQGREKELQNLFHCSPKSSKSTKWWDTKRRLVGSVLEIPFTRCTTYWLIEKRKIEKICDKIQSIMGEIIQKKLPRNVDGMYSHQRSQWHSLSFAWRGASRTPKWEKAMANGFTPEILLAYNAKRCPRLRQEISRMPKAREWDTHQPSESPSNYGSISFPQLGARFHRSYKLPFWGMCIDIGSHWAIY